MNTCIRRSKSARTIRVFDHYSTWMPCNTNNTNKNSINNLPMVLNIRFKVEYFALELSFFDPPTIWLRLQRFAIRLDDESRSETPFANIWSVLIHAQTWITGLFAPTMCVTLTNDVMQRGIRELVLHKCFFNMGIRWHVYVTEQVVKSV